MLAVFVVQGVGVLLMNETSSTVPGALAYLRPQLRLPAALLSPVLLVAPLLIAAWALAGFYGSLGPAFAAGVRVVHGRGLAHTAWEYWLGVIALSLLALAGAVIRRPK